MDTIWLRKETGQSGIAGYWWENDGDAVEVPWELGVNLLGLKGAGFSQVPDDEVVEDSDQSVDTETGYDPGLPGDVPTGTAAEILDWVGADSGRAEAALQAEKGRGGDARTSLIAKLEKLAS